MAVAATALGGLAVTTLLEVKGVPIRRAGVADTPPAAAVAPVLSARHHDADTMRLVPSERITSRPNLYIRASSSVPERVTRPTVAVMAASDRGRQEKTSDVSRVSRVSRMETRNETRTAGVGPLPLASAATAARPPASPTLSTESASARGEVAAATNVRDVDAAALPLAGRRREDERDIYQVLQQYERAYERLDVNAARAVWPSLNTRALARAFDGLKEQSLEFSQCRVAMESREATAICGGHASYVPRVGHQTTRTEPREWTFRLQKVDQGWLIAKTEVR